MRNLLEFDLMKWMFSITLSTTAPPNPFRFAKRPSSQAANKSSISVICNSCQMVFTFLGPKPLIFNKLSKPGGVCSIICSKSGQVPEAATSFTIWTTTLPTPGIANNSASGKAEIKPGNLSRPRAAKARFLLLNSFTPCKSHSFTKSSSASTI